MKLEGLVYRVWSFDLNNLDEGFYKQIQKVYELFWCVRPYFTEVLLRNYIVLENTRKYWKCNVN